MTLYLDLIWLLNFLFDSLLLYLTAIVLKRDVRYWRVLCGGFLGSIIILLSLTPMNDYSGHPLVKLLFSVLMVLIVFGYKRFKSFFSCLLIFYVTTFLVGGSLIGAHYFIQFDNQLSSTVFLASVQGFGDPISWLFVVLGFPIAWHFSRRNFDRIEIAKIQYDQLVDIHIVLNEQSFLLKGLVDSGNQLYDPISKMPVMFVAVGKGICDFPHDIIQMAEDAEEIILGNKVIDSHWESRMRIIPYKAMGQSHSLIIALKPDSMTIMMKEERISVEKGLVSFTTQQLSSDDVFHCIVHPKMLNGQRTTESA